MTLTHTHSVSTENFGTLDYALWYASLGWYVFPTRGATDRAKAKQPAEEIKHWSQDSSNDPKQLAAWFGASAYGIGVDCGKSDLVALDADRLSDIPEGLSLDGAWILRGNPERRTFIFNQPLDVIGCAKAGWKAGEVKGAGGYICLPPSFHAVGGTYVWLQREGSRLMPEGVRMMLAKAVDFGAYAFSQSWLTFGSPCAAVKRILNRWIVSLKSGAHPAMVHGQTALVGLGSKGHAGVREALGHLRQAFIDEVTRQGRSGGRVRTEGEALDEWDEALRNLVLSEPKLSDLDYSGCDCLRCAVTLSPSLSPLETVESDSGATSVTLSLSPDSERETVNEPVTLLSPSLSPLPPAEGESDRSDKVTEVTDPPSLSTLRNGVGLYAVTYGEVTWVVPNLIPEGLTLLVGRPKIGKSWLVFDIALAAASGGTVLGEGLSTRPVLHLALEDGDRRLRERGEALGYDVGYPLYWYATHLPEGFSAGQMIEDWLATLSDELLPPLVIIDTLGKTRRGQGKNESSYDYDYRVGSGIKRIADSVPGMSIVLVHHDRKADSSDFVDSVSGTNGLAGAADTILVVRRKRVSSEGALLVTGRDINEAEYAADFSEGRWTLQGGSWATAGRSANSAVAAAGKGETAHRIIQWLAVNGEATPMEIAEALGLDYDVAKQTCFRLAKDERLSKPRRGVYAVSDV